ncbi:sensitivity to high expression protein she9, partial [Claviceps africana]
MQPLGAPMARVALAAGRRMLKLQPPVLAAKPRTACRPSSLANSRCILNRANLRPAIRATRLFSSSSNPASDADSRPSSASGAEATPGETRAKHEPRPLAIELPSETDGRRSKLNQTFSHVMDNVQARVLTASQTLNDITGYSAIEAIKSENELLEGQLAAAHDTVRAARQAYKLSNTKRATTQREVTTLLARKDTWSPSDLERFTELYRTDHELEGEVAKAQEALTESEIEEQSLSQRLNAGILKRYHEEQIWSDRIRRASTWGTWGLMGMNFLLFVVLQFFAEPWRRRRLVRGVVEEGERAMEHVVDELASVKLSLA